MSPDGIRERLREKITALHGDLSPKSLRSVARLAGVSETTLGRYVSPERFTGRAIDRPRDTTLRALAAALDVNFGWLRDGQGSEQLTVWPVIVREVAERSDVAPIDELRGVVDRLEGHGPDVVRAACRAATAGIIAAIAEGGEMVPPEAYRAMIRLDAQRRPEAKAAG